MDRVYSMLLTLVLIAITVVDNVACQSKGELSIDFDCVIYTQSYSGYTQACYAPSEGFLQLNGNTVWRGGWCSSAPNHRGINTWILDPATCTAYNFRTFDTHGSGDNAADLAAYLNWVRDGAVVIGITGDEPVRNLGPALRTLNAAGVFVADVQYRGNFAFILQKGYPEKTRMAKSIYNIGSHATIKVAVRGTSPDNLKFDNI